ncbi:MAG: Uma2 family endonuclease [Planctomycetales bacterium]
MSTATITPPQSAGCVTLRHVGWDFYERFLDETRGQRFRHAYRDGNLSITSPGMAHERSKSRIGRMIETLTEELGIPICTVGSLTLKEVVERVGAEADEAYYVKNELRMRDKPEFDPETDPPPDLLVEVDITSPSLDRLDIYAAIGVPKVWVYDGKSLRVHLLSKRGAYRESKRSDAFPFLPMPEFAAWLEKSRDTDETTWIRAFRQWVRERWGKKES